MRELFPVSQEESDFALKLRLELLAKIVLKVGAENFIAAVKLAISQSRGRYDVTILRISECAGITRTAEPSPAMKAWAIVAYIVRNHVKQAPEGGWRLETHVVGRFLDGEWKHHEEPVPFVPLPIKNAVNALGGWAALAETEPVYWSQRMRDFTAVYDETPRTAMEVVNAPTK